jgi:hypothetical protein
VRAGRVVDAVPAAARCVDAYPTAGPAAAFARERWNDGVSEILVRGISPPETIGTAAALTAQAVGDFVATLAPISAAASIFAVAPRVDLAHFASVRVPARASPLSPAQAMWIDENNPIPATQLVLGAGAVLSPKKLVAIAALSRELAEHTNAEEVFALLLRENTSLTLDATVFSTLAATGAHPAGILAGIAPLAPTPGCGDTCVYRKLRPFDPVTESLTSATMVALISFLLNVVASLFKSKSRLEAENAALRHQLIVLQTQGARSRPLSNCNGVHMLSSVPVLIISRKAFCRLTMSNIPTISHQLNSPDLSP